MFFGGFAPQRRLCTSRMRAPVGGDCARIAVPRQRRELLAGRRPEQPFERVTGRAGQLADRGDAAFGELRACDRPDPPHQADRQVVQESQLGRGVDDHKPIGLGHLRRDLGKVLGAGDADRDRQAELTAHPPADLDCYVLGGTEEVGAAGDVGERLVDGYAFDQRREIVEHLDRGVAEPLVVLEVAADEDQLRAEFPRSLSGHSATHPECLRLIGCGENDTAAHRYGPAAQRGVQKLFDRGVERVEVGMQDGGGGFHATSDTGLGHG